MEEKKVRCYICGNESDTLKGNKLWYCSLICQIDSCTEAKANGCLIQFRSLHYLDHALQKQYGTRFVYQELVGPIKKTDHVKLNCGNPRCLNPEHMEAIDLMLHLRQMKRGRKMVIPNRI